MAPDPLLRRRSFEFIGGFLQLPDCRGGLPGRCTIFLQFAAQHCNGRGKPIQDRYGLLAQG
jgi:hypothetical protein